MCSTTMGEGWVTAENYAALVEDNFGGRSRPDPIDENRIVRDLAGCDPAMGIVNRDLML